MMITGELSHQNLMRGWREARVPIHTLPVAVAVLVRPCVFSLLRHGDDYIDRVSVT